MTKQELADIAGLTPEQIPDSIADGGMFEAQGKLLATAQQESPNVPQLNMLISILTGTPVTDYISLPSYEA